MLLRLLACALALSAWACSPSPAPAGSVQGGRVLTLVALAEVRGTTEPCGCTSRPLGDVARVATLVHDAERQGATLFLDAGGRLYGATAAGAAQHTQEELKAAFLAETWKTLAGGALVALGEEDLRAPADHPALWPMLAANVSGLPTIPWTMRELDGVKVGVFAVVEPEVVGAARPAKVKIDDPVLAAQRTVAELTGQGAKLIVALVHGPRSSARRLLRTVAGIGIAIVGHDVGLGSPAEQIGPAILLQPGDQAQKLSWIELHLSADGRISTQLVTDDAGRKERMRRVTSRLGMLDAELARIEHDPAADPAYLATRRQERTALRGEKMQLEQPQAAPPPPYALAKLVAVERRVPRDARVGMALQKLAGQIGESNRQLAATIKVPAPLPGAPRYTGNRVCGECHDHDEDWTFWKGTSHARAWAELVRVSKQWSHDCIRCHVTGYSERGGSAMAHVDGLTDVGCETCHGAGSLHAAKPKQVHMPIAIPDERLCKTCHTPEHSDTFQFEAYLRNIVGQGHGAERRQKLGAGPTGRELRQAAVEKAQSAP